MRNYIYHGILFVFSLLLVVSCTSTTSTIKNIKSGETIKVVFGSPSGDQKYPAVIYNHGTFVRKMGYSDAVSSGYDINDFVKALNKAGYVAIAPIRKTGRLKMNNLRQKRRNVMKGPPLEWNDGVTEGLELVESAINYLKEQPNVDSERIGIIGFSEGGNITLWSSLERTDFKAVVLMSPANLVKSFDYRFSNALPLLNQISAPVFLTVGSEDLPVIIRNCESEFIPTMTRLKKDFDYRTDYPGDHEWFWKVRPEYWNDIITFLDKNLKNQ